MKTINENIHILWSLILNIYKTSQNISLFLAIDGTANEKRQHK